MRCEKCGKDYPSKYYFKIDTVCVECFNKMDADERQKALFDSDMKHPLTSTTFTIEGYRIVQQLGVVRGIVVRSRSVFGTLGASLQTVFGGNITLFTELCEKTRGESFDLMVEHANRIGANAIVGVRYDTTELMDGVSEVLCYGTAVVVEPIK
jgi:uncharacterized protein YbjQ (UPF0145 family)